VIKPPANAVRLESIALPMFHRDAAIVASSANEANRTFDVVWTAGAEVRRYDWYREEYFMEVLEVTDAAIRLDRLNSGRAPVLDAHMRWSLSSVIGVVEKGSVSISGGESRATLRLSNRQALADIVQDIRDGIIANVSCGYVTHAFREEMRGSMKYRIATDWEPNEISFVPVGADAAAGLRSIDGKVAPDPSLPTFPCNATRIAAAAPVQPVAPAVLARMRMAARARGLAA
jgi:hypothetical protein